MSPSFVPRVSGTWTISLSVTDSKQAPSPVTVTWTFHVNARPSARITRTPAGENIAPATTVTLDGSASSDPEDGSGITRYWTLINEVGVDQSTLLSSQTAASVTFTKGAGGIGQWTAILSVSDTKLAPYTARNTILISVNSGTLDWSLVGSGKCFGSPAVGGTLGRIWAARELTGVGVDNVFEYSHTPSEAGDHPADFGFPYISPAIVKARVYVGSDSNGTNGGIACIEHNNIGRKWQYSVGNRHVRSSPAVVTQGNLKHRVYFGTDALGGTGTGQVLCVRDDTGTASTLLWQYDLPSAVNARSSPSIMEVRGVETCIIGASNGHIYFLQQGSGTTASVYWDYTPTGTSPNVTCSPAIAPDGTVYVVVRTSGDDKVVRLDPTNKTMLQEFTPDLNGKEIPGSVIVAPGGSVFFGTLGSEDGQSGFYRLSSSLVKTWGKTPSDLGLSTSTRGFRTPVLGAGGTLDVLASESDQAGTARLVAVRSSDGVKVWIYAPGVSMSWNSTIDMAGNLNMGSRGLVYFIDDGATLRAIHTMSGGLATEGWPAWRRNAEQTGSAIEPTP